jgi:hypothetical protein
VKNEHLRIHKVLVFRDRSDRAASLRDARRAVVVRSTSVPLLLCGFTVASVASVFGGGYTAGEIDVILKSSIFIAGTSAVPGKS